jgi:hypothetical protein
MVLLYQIGIAQPAIAAALGVSMNNLLFLMEQRKNGIQFI